MRGQLQGSLRAVPAVPGKLVLAFLYPTLGPCCHAAGVDEVGLGGWEDWGRVNKETNPGVTVSSLLLFLH